MHNHKNILYIGPYREFSGAGNAARNYIQALFNAGHDICIAPIFNTGEIYPENEISSDILPLENNHLKRYDIVIQHCHPFDYVFNSKFDCNIGLYQFNCGSINRSISSRLGLMDKIIVNSEFNKRIIQNTFDLTNITVVPELIDTSIKNRNHIGYNWLENSKNRPIVFYTIGDFIERKNIYAIIKAFVHIFNYDDNVELIIKTKPHYSHKKQDIIHKELEYYINKIYSTLRKNKKNSKQPKIMVGQFEYKHLLALHYNANIYIDASMAENFGYTVLEAALFDNYLIVNENSSTSEISSNCFKTASRPISVSDSYTSSFIDNTISDIWYDINFDNLCENIYKAYHAAIANPKSTHIIDKYTYDNIGYMI